MMAQVKYMGVVVNMESFKAARRGSGRFESLTCPICDKVTEARDRGDVVAYVCTGGEIGHARLEWTHDPSQVSACA